MTHGQDRKPNQQNKQAEKATGDQTKRPGEPWDRGTDSPGPPAEQVREAAWAVSFVDPVPSRPHPESGRVW